MPTLESNQRSTFGYTVTELLTVMLILSIAMAGSAYFVVERSAQASITRMGSQIASMASAAASEAVLTQREIQLIVDPVEKVISLSGEEPLQIPEDFRLELITARSEVLSEGRAAIRFFPEGGATGGSIRLYEGEEAGLSVDVDWLTGRVSIVEVFDEAA